MSKHTVCASSNNLIDRKHQLVQFENSSSL